jgi:FRG domain
MDAWSKVLTEVEATTNRLSKVGCDIPFFRGHGDTSWTLIPSLGRQRPQIKNLETIIYYDVLTRSGSLIPAHSSTWDLLFIARHHGLPTRLLDWTEVFSVALFFACRDFTSEATIWVLDPFRLNNATMKDESILHPESDLECSYYEYFITQQTKFPYEAIALLPNKSNVRVAAQKCVFTLHGNLKRGLEVWPAVT